MNPVRLILLSVLMAVLIGLAACSREVQPTATAVPQPTATFTPTSTPLPTDTPTATPTATPTNTPSPTSTNTPTATPTATPSPTPTPELVLDDPTIVESGGFSFQAATGYEAEVTNEGDFGLAFLSGEGDAIIINIIGVPQAEDYLSGKSDSEIIEELTADFVGNMNGTFESGDTFTMTVGNVVGTALDLTGELFDAPFIGQAVYSNPTGSQTFFAIALSRDSEIWETRGKQAFAAMLESVQFESTAVETEPTAVEEGGDSSVADSPCVISTDPTYGYTEANAVQVGGDAFDGPPRERAYLDNLRGPNGESISYERAGSVPYDDTFLDIYVLTFGETTATLFLDEYNWSEPKAPIDFTCAAAFPLTPP